MILITDYPSFCLTYPRGLRIEPAKEEKKEEQKVTDCALRNMQGTLKAHQRAATSQRNQRYYHVPPNCNPMDRWVHRFG